MVNVPVDAPAAMVIEAGTVTDPGYSSESWTTHPPAGAGDAKVIVPVAVCEATIDPGLTVMLCSESPLMLRVAF
jgi:hypothetical protein